MLPAQHRLTRRDDLRRVSRAGRRAASETLVVHLMVPEPPAVAPPTRVGLVVSRAVGGSVVRHLVQRRLRHLCRERLTDLPVGSELVVRALPPAANATYQELGVALDRCLERALPDGRGDRGPGPGTVS
jgi:ribonuclease P protein component